MIEWLKNMDWALFVAVLSLLFTGMVSFITIRYTRRSLAYTKLSTKIASKSLRTAKKSIDTSIKIYQDQKDEDERKRKTELKGLIAITRNHMFFCSEAVSKNIISVNRIIDSNANIFSMLQRPNNGAIIRLISDKVDELAEIVNIEFNIDLFALNIAKYDSRLLWKLVRLTKSAKENTNRLNLTLEQLSGIGHSDKLSVAKCTFEPILPLLNMLSDEVREIERILDSYEV